MDTMSLVTIIICGATGVYCLGVFGFAIVKRLIIKHKIKKEEKNNVE